MSDIGLLIFSAHEHCSVVAKRCKKVHELSLEEKPFVRRRHDSEHIISCAKVMRRYQPRTNQPYKIIFHQPYPFFPDRVALQQNASNSTHSRLQRPQTLHLLRCTLKASLLTTMQAILTTHIPTGRRRPRKTKRDLRRLPAWSENVFPAPTSLDHKNLRTSLYSTNG